MVCKGVGCFWTAYVLYGVVVRGHLRPAQLSIVPRGGVSVLVAWAPSRPGKTPESVQARTPILGQHQLQLPLRPHSKEARWTCPGESQTNFIFFKHDV
jgi:hypothetical protein